MSHAPHITTAGQMSNLDVLDLCRDMIADRYGDRARFQDAFNMVIDGIEQLEAGEKVEPEALCPPLSAYEGTGWTGYVW